MELTDGPKTWPAEYLGRNPGRGAGCKSALGRGDEDRVFWGLVLKFSQFAASASSLSQRSWFIEIRRNQWKQ